MGSEKLKIRMDPVNDLERIQSLAMFNRSECENVIRIIKTEEGEMNYNQNQMLFDLNKNLWELRNQAHEKNRIVLDYLIQEETEVAKMEKEIEALKQKTQMDNETIEEMRSRVLESEVREQKLREYNTKANQTVEKLRRRISACEEEKRTSDRVREEMRIRESDLRRQKLEAERAAEVMAGQVLIADQRVKEMQKRGLEVCNAAEVNMTRLGKLLKMNVDDMVSLKDKFVWDDDDEEGFISTSAVSGGFGNGEAGGPHASKPLEFTLSEPSTKKRYSHETRTTPSSDVPTAAEIMDIINCDDKEFPTIIPKRKRSKREVRANYKSPFVTTTWMIQDNMVRALEEDDELCMHAVCALYRQLMSTSESTECPSRTLYHFEASRGRYLGYYLIDGDPELKLTRSVAEVRQRYPNIVNQCRRLAIDYSSYFVAMPKPVNLILACEERKELGESGFGRKESEPDQVMACELSKTEETVKNQLAIMWNNLVGAADGSKSKGLEPT